MKAFLYALGAIVAISIVAGVVMTNIPAWSSKNMYSTDSVRQTD